MTPRTLPCALSRLGEKGPNGSIVDQGTYRELAKRHDLTTLVERINSATSSSESNSTAASASAPASASAAAAAALDVSVELNAAVPVSTSASTPTNTGSDSPTGSIANSNSTAGSIATEAALSMGDVPGTGLECNEANECIPKYKDSGDDDDDMQHKHKHQHGGKVSGKVNGWRVLLQH